MGKSSQVTDDLEERRRVTRELNEATKDARAAERDLSAAVKNMTDLLAELCKTRELLPAVVDAQVRSLLAEAKENISANMSRLSDRISIRNAELFGYTTPEGFIRRVSADVAEILKDDMLEGIDHIMAQLTEAWLNKHVKMGKLRAEGGMIQVSLPE